VIESAASVREGDHMNNWQSNFLDKLNKVQTQWVRSFESTMDRFIMAAFEDVASFVRDNGFKVSTPLQDDGRRSFKFELSENAYLLMIFRFSGVGEFELRCESFTPGGEPTLSKSMMRLADVDEEWAGKQFQSALDSFLEAMAGSRFQQAEALSV
jgi:hypothetical protein